MKRWISIFILLAGCLNSNTVVNETKTAQFTLALFLKEAQARGLPIMCNSTNFDYYISENYSLIFTDNVTFLILNGTYLYNGTCFKPTNISINVNYTYFPELPYQCEVSEPLNITLC